MINDDAELFPRRKHARTSQAPHASLMPESPRSPLTRATSASEVRSCSGTSGSVEVGGFAACLVLRALFTTFAFQGLGL